MSDTARRCLLIDDDPDDQFLFILALEKVFPDMICEVAADGQHAFDLLETPRVTFPSVIFLDINMPRMDGIECLRRLKAHPFFRQIPVFIYTTSLQKGIEELCKSIGAAGCTVKYSKLDDLLTYLQTVLRPHFEVLC